MNKVQLSGVVLALGAAAMFSMTPVSAATTDAGAAPMVSCKGVNSCKSPNNACKGQGTIQMSKEDCEKAGGTVADSTNDTTNTNTNSTTQQGGAAQ